MNSALSKKLGKGYFVCILISLSLLIIGIVFLMLGHNEVVYSTDLNNGDVGFGYSAAGVISIFLSLFTSVAITISYFFNKKETKAD